jgi:hypothetical protein
MHRLLESQPMASDEQIDRAFASAEAQPAPEPVKRGKGLVISKKAAAERPARAEPKPEPVPDPVPSVEVSRPALSLGSEQGKSRAGLYVAIGVASLALVGAVVFFSKSGKTPPPPAVNPEPTTTTASASSTSAAPSTAAPSTAPATTSTGPVVEPTKVIDQKALEAELKKALEAKKKEREAAVASGKETPVPVVPGKTGPTIAPASISLAPQQPLQPPKAAEQPTRVPEAPKPTPEPVKIAAAPPVEPPKVVERPPDVAPPASSAAVQVGDLVGPGDGVVEPRLLKLGALILPPQAKQLSRGQGGVIGTPMIMALVSEKGVVSETRILRASNYKFVDEAAENALKSATIEAATKNGVKVKMWKTFSIPVKP